MYVLAFTFRVGFKLGSWVRELRNPPGSEDIRYTAIGSGSGRRLILKFFFDFPTTHIHTNLIYFCLQMRKRQCRSSVKEWTR